MQAARRRSVKRNAERIKLMAADARNTVIKIITIEREYGCGGREIAQKIADRLGWKLWDQLLTCGDCPAQQLRSGGGQMSRRTGRPALLSALQIDHARQLRRQPECAPAEVAGCRQHSPDHRASGPDSGINWKLCHRRQRVAAFLAQSGRHLARLPLRPEGRESAPPYGWRT